MSNRLRTGAAVVILAAIVLAMYWPVFGHQFLSFDDDINIYQNSYLRLPICGSVLHFWKQPHEDLYIPVTYTVWAVEAALTAKGTPDDVQLSPVVFHAGNLLLHFLNAVLVFVILKKVTAVYAKGKGSGGVWGAGLGAALFALHPVQVEAVSWATGMKDLLSTFFALLTVLLYLRFRQRHKPALSLAYAAVLLTYGLAVLAKPGVIALPLALWAVDFWLAGKSVRESAKALLPVAALAVPLTLINRAAQSAHISSSSLPFWTRPFVAGDAVAFYLYKTLLPVGLVPDYGRSPEYVMSHWWGYAMWLVPAGLAVLICHAARRHGVWAAVGVIFAAGILPVCGIVPFEMQAMSTVADRYMYLSMFGISLALSMLVFHIPTLRVKAGAAVVLLVFAVLSGVQCTRWRDTGTLFDYVLRVNPGSWTAHNNLGWTLFDKGDADGALRHMRQAVDIRPEDSALRGDLAALLVNIGRPDEAETEYREATVLKPEDARAHYNLGYVLLLQKKYQEGVSEVAESLRLDPALFEAHTIMAGVFVSQRRYKEASEHYRQALNLRPKDAAVRVGLANVYLAMGHVSDAVDEYRSALKINPDIPQAHKNLAVALYFDGRYREAWDEVKICRENGVRLSPRFIQDLSRKMPEPAR